MLALNPNPKHKGDMSIQTYYRIPALLCILGATCAALAADNPFLGEWALTIPGGAAGWFGQIQKAKAARPIAERLITMGKNGTVHDRRQAISELGSTSAASSMYCIRS